MCKGVVGNYNIFVPANQTQADLEAVRYLRLQISTFELGLCVQRVIGQQFLFAVAGTPSCLNALAEYMCSGIFRKCARAVASAHSLLTGIVRADATLA